MIAAIPWKGPTLRQFITGGGAIGTVSLEHLYTLQRYILSVGAIALSILHLTSLVLQQRADAQRLALMTATDPQSQTSAQNDEMTV